MKLRLVTLSVLAVVFAANAQVPDPGPANSNDLARLEKSRDTEDRKLRTKIDELQVQVDQLKKTVGERQGADRYAPISRSLRDLERQVDQLDRRVRAVEEAARRSDRAR